MSALDNTQAVPSRRSSSLNSRFALHNQRTNQDRAEMARGFAHDISYLLNNGREDMLAMNPSRATAQLNN